MALIWGPVNFRGNTVLHSAACDNNYLSLTYKITKIGREEHNTDCVVLSTSVSCSLIKKKEKKIFECCGRNKLKFINLKWIKVGLSPSKKNCVICFIESHLRMMKNAFNFILNALFVLKIFKFLSWLLGHVEKTVWLEREGWFQNSWRHNLVNKQLQYTYCPISHEVKATKQLNLVN